MVQRIITVGRTSHATLNAAATAAMANKTDDAVAAVDAALKDLQQMTGTK
jgi:hypothetical protein